MDESKEEVRVIFVTSNDAAKVLEPTDRAFNFPSTTIATQWATVLRRWFDAIASVGTDQFDAALKEAFAQQIAVGGTVVN